MLYTFTGGSDGAFPIAGLIADGAGNLYGTTQLGGDTSSSCPNGSYGCGVVFKLRTAGEHYKVLYTFSGGADGRSPWAGLFPYKGSLYGTTAGGGDTTGSCPNGAYGCGVVFKLH